MADRFRSSFAESILGQRGEGDVLEAPPEEPSGLARRNIGQDLMLELRFKNGDSASIAYAYLARVNYSADKGIKLFFSVCEVIIEGYNLRQLYDEIVVHKRSFVEEYSKSALQLAGKDVPQVTRITIPTDSEEQNA